MRVYALATDMLVGGHMKWVRSYSEQARICRDSGNQFIVKNVIVCLPFKTYCHSQACYLKRYPIISKLRYQGWLMFNKIYPYGWKHLI